MQDLLKLLSLAVRCSRPRVVEAILAEDFNKDQALNQLLENGDVGAVLALIAANTEMFRGPKGDFASVTSHLSRVIHRLIHAESYAHLDRDPCNGDARDSKIVELMEKGELSEAAVLIWQSCDDAQLILMLAACFGHLSIMNTLIAAGADINAMNREGRTALMVASRFGQTAVVNALIDAGCQIDASWTNKSELILAERARTALIIASIFGQLEISEALIEAKAKLNIQDGRGRTALTWAVAEENFEIANLLIGAGADVDKCDNADKNALMLAVEKGHTEFTSLLLRSGANCNFRNCDGDIALIMAVKNYDIETVRALIAAKAKLNRSDDEGETALTIAVRGQCSDIVRVLIEAGAIIPDSGMFVEEGGECVEVFVYRPEDTDWTLEVVASDGFLTVWPRRFASDKEALAEGLSAIKDKGIKSFSEGGAMKAAMR